MGQEFHQWEKNNEHIRLTPLPWLSEQMNTQATKKITRNKQVTPLLASGMIHRQAGYVGPERNLKIPEQKLAQGIAP